MKGENIILVAKGLAVIAAGIVLYPLLCDWRPEVSDHNPKKFRIQYGHYKGRLCYKYTLNGGWYWYRIHTAIPPKAENEDWQWQVLIINGSLQLADFDTYAKVRTYEDTQASHYILGNTIVQRKRNLI